MNFFLLIFFYFFKFLYLNIYIVYIAHIILSISVHKCVHKGVSLGVVALFLDNGVSLGVVALFVHTNGLVLASSPISAQKS